MYTKTFLVLLALALPSTTFADVTNKRLMESCTDKTIVYGREDGELVKAGEKLSGYCAGFLDASLASLTSSETCKSQGEDPDFLLSTYMQYVDDKDVAENEGAYQTLTDAFSRIIQCE